MEVIILLASLPTSHNSEMKVWGLLQQQLQCLELRGHLHRCVCVRVSGWTDPPSQSASLCLSYTHTLCHPEALDHGKSQLYSTSHPLAPWGVSKDKWVNGFRHESSRWRPGVQPRALQELGYSPKHQKLPRMLIGHPDSWCWQKNSKKFSDLQEFPQVPDELRIWFPLYNRHISLKKKKWSVFFFHNDGI